MSYIKTWASEEAVLATDLNGNFANAAAARYITLTAGEALSAGQPLALGTYQADGGIQYYNKAYGQLSGTGSTRTVGFDVGSGVNRFLIVCVDTDTNGSGSCTYGGVSMTADGYIHGSSRYWHCFSLYAPTAGSNNIVISGLYTGAGYVIQYMAYAYYNVLQTSGYVFSGTLYSNVGSFSKSVTPAGVGDLVVALVGTNATNGTQSLSYPTQNALSQVDNPFLFGADTGILAATTAINIAGSRTAGTIDWEVATWDLKPFSAVSYAVFKASSATATPNKYDSFFGFANAAASSGASVDVIVGGVVSGLSGLAVGSKYYLNDTAGTIGTSAGTNTRKVGIAISATQLLITNTW